jgi:hypothetical protein
MISWKFDDHHSITVTFVGKVSGGRLNPEAYHPYGVKIPRWFSPEEICAVAYHPPGTVEKALAFRPVSGEMSDGNRKTKVL